MLLLPSITIINGRTVRLTKGDFSHEKVYKNSPLEVAKNFESHGITTIYLIDLEGAQKGSPANYDCLQLVSGHTSLNINFSGGLHTDGSVLKIFEYGAASITAATVAVHNKEMFFNWIMSYGREKIMLAADSLNGTIRVGGWQKSTKIDLYEHIEYFYDRGLKYLKTTDISKDGALEGPSFDLYADLTKRFPNLSIFASGGVRHMDDIKKLADQGLHGTIFGKAFYEGKITLKEIESFVAINV